MKFTIAMQTGCDKLFLKYSRTMHIFNENLFYF